MFAPISTSGLIALPIGLLDKDLSPQNERFNPIPEVKPSINLKPVPELPRSKESLQSKNARSLLCK